ncbi:MULTISPECIES: FtsX-like permease family protein [Nocardia]|uniref:ABC transporter permease n=1 Tax=Nocardia TaxID=1817 RepID=UPI0007E9A281|nr:MULTISPECIES: FtsX-like permease family protein [Nocardia]MBF6274691.1 FtsX-like permease family protein [Nocardia nova]OBA52420.1 ABC transporter permease [Nocardia sp. 852002-51101_SCH5132738]OBB55049.1 ABC transporter permease [Nocardia sp. 852002-51244_SCH5132740]OBF68125.1 ABC transporter permease [Mycobacterium sp. 852002-51759_SCH5129042]
MFLALRELWYARVRFGLMGGVVALISILTVMLSGLSSGLVDDGVSGLRSLPFDAFAFAHGTKTDSAFTRSTIDTAQVAAWRSQPGVADAAPFGNTLVNAKTGGGVAVDFALFGVEPQSFLAPAAAQGTGLDRPDGIVVSATALDKGARLGDTVVIDRLGTTLTIVGVTAGKQTFGHVDVAYVPLHTWQQIHAGAKPGEQVREQSYREASAVALRAQPGAKLDLTAGDAAADTTAMTRTASYDASPGYTAEMATMTMIKAFLYAISALVVGAFFLVWTIQRTGELAVLRAIGAPTRFLLVDGLTQAVVVLVGATAIGVLIAVGGSSFIHGMPFTLEPAAVATGAGLLVLLGVLGAAAAIVRVTRIDPLTALGANR